MEDLHHVKTATVVRALRDQINDTDYELAETPYALRAWVTETGKLGIATVEALACGTPVLALGEGGVLDIVEDGREGLLYDPSDPQALAGQLRALPKAERQVVILKLLSGGK